MKYNKEELDRMNRSGQRGGAVGSNATVCTRKLLDWVRDGALNHDAVVFDFGAGSKAQQATILRHDAGLTVIPYDVGANAHPAELSDITRSDVVMMSNVLNVQPSMGHVVNLLATVRSYAKPGTILLCNLPREPRYGNQTPRRVAAALEAAGWTIVGQHSYGSGMMWEARA